MAHIHLGLTYEMKAMFEEAIAAYQRGISLTGSNSLLLGLGQVYAKAGKRDEAQVIFDKLKELAKRRYTLPTWFAHMYTYLGETDQAFEWLERAYEEHDPWLVWLKVNAVFDCVRSDPRFSNLLERVGLPLWRAGRFSHRMLLFKIVEFNAYRLIH